MNQLEDKIENNLLVLEDLIFESGKTNLIFVITKLRNSIIKSGLNINETRFSYNLSYKDKRILYNEFVNSLNTQYFKKLFSRSWDVHVTKNSSKLGLVCSYFIYSHYVPYTSLGANYKTILEESKFARLFLKKLSEGCKDRFKIKTKFYANFAAHDTSNQRILQFDIYLK